MGLPLVTSLSLRYPICKMGVIKIDVRGLLESLLRETTDVRHLALCFAWNGWNESNRSNDYKVVPAGALGDSVVKHLP